MIKTKKAKPRCPICNRISSTGVCIRCIDVFIKLKLVGTTTELSQNINPDEPQTYVFEDE
jgi:hypothetical protein